MQQSIESVMSAGYEDFKEYTTKLVNARSQLVDKSVLEGKTEGEKAEIIRVKTTEECIDTIIVECAIEVDKLFDSRIRYHIDDEWKKLFMSMDDIDPKNPETYFKNNFFQYAINSKLMLDSRYPTRKYVVGGKSGATGMPYELTSGGPPSFEVVQYAKEAHKLFTEAEAIEATTPAQMALLKPIPFNTGGGLYYEPYVRLKSTLALDEPDDLAYTYSDAPLQAETKIEEIYDEDTGTTKKYTTVTEVLGSIEQHAYFRIFWGKLKEAFNDWANQTHRPNTTDINTTLPSYLGGELFDHFNTSGLLTKDVFHHAINNKNNSEWPRGAGSTFYQGDNLSVHRAHNFLKSLIVKIDQEQEDHNVLVFKTAGGSKSTFWEFFDLFFAPLSQKGIPFSEGPDSISKAYGMTATNQAKIDHRSVFGNIVSSFRHHKHPDGIPGNQIKYGAPGWFPGDPGIAPAAGELGWSDAFYYWQFYPDGIIPAAKVHFLNRGVINFSSIDTKNNLIWSNKNFLSTESPAIAHALGDLSVADASIINLYALSKNSTFGIGSTIEIESAAPTWSTLTAEQQKEMEEKAAAEGDDPTLAPPGKWTGASLFNQVTNSSQNFMKSIQDFMLKHDTENICKLVPAGTFDNPLWSYKESNKATLDRNAPAVCSFYNWFKSTIIESRFDRWFEVSLGMRLNLVIPFEDPNNKKLSNKYLKALIDTALDQPAGQSTRREYTLDKVFLLSEPEAVCLSNLSSTIYMIIGRKCIIYIKVPKKEKFTRELQLLMLSKPMDQSQSINKAAGLIRGTQL